MQPPKPIEHLIVTCNPSLVKIEEAIAETYQTHIPDLDSNHRCGPLQVLDNERTGNEHCGKWAEVESGVDCYKVASEYLGR